MAEAVILMGFMGSGKSAVGARLAATTGAGFIDCDSLVEERMGMTITEAFAQRGEEFFRGHEESEVLSLLEKVASGNERTVIALGGGAVTSAAVRERLEREPYCIWLDVDTDTAFQRSHGSGRPLAGDREDFARLYEQRREMYRRLAKMTVYNIDRRLDDVVSEIQRQLRQAGLR